ncbi:hypothetical protein F5Y17DRAFT_412212 [Xylariaceae sp. FL0594]|nr:hypothetical protein F5Y17DRAFT_412212 [Xylariaceae sp. FL0594]
MSDNNPATPPAAAGDAPSGLSAGDSKFFLAMAKHLPKSLEIDWEALAKDLNLKSGNVAKTRYRQIRTKHGLNEPAASGAPATPATPATPTPKKQAANRVTKPRKTPTGGRGGRTKKAVKADALETALENSSDVNDQHVAIGGHEQKQGQQQQLKAQQAQQAQQAADPLGHSPLDSMFNYPQGYQANYDVLQWATALGPGSNPGAGAGATSGNNLQEY